MTTFAAIDFELANYTQSSVCSVGVVLVRDGKIAEKIYRLIHPRPNYYNWFTDIHGLCNSDTCNAPDFPAVWAEIAPKIAGLPLVAHNSPFDEGCLRAAHEAYRMPYPVGYVFHCTCRASRRLFGNILPNHQLHTVAAHCGFNLQNHHHALADAEACAVIALNVFN
jgi:DNA polymerase-3 subunit epsilon